MYPRVKVREQEDPIPIEEETTSYLLRVIESLSIEGHCSSRILADNHGSECKNDPPYSHAKISKSYPKNSLRSRISIPKGKNNTGLDEDNRTNIRASSIPRPRAVLSSPDNDEMIGNQNQLIRKRETLLKRQNQNTHSQDTDRTTGKQNQLIRKSGTPSRSRASDQNTHAQVKLSQMNARVSTPLRTREVAIEVGKNTHPKEKHASELSTPRLRPSIKRW